MKTRRCVSVRVCFAVAIMFAAAIANCHALTLHVSPVGNDAWSGGLATPNAERTDGPLASIAGARDALRRRAVRDEPVEVVIADGRYVIEEPIVFEPRDSGTATAPISYVAARGAHPIISGGRVIRGWQVGADGVWTTRIAEVASGAWRFEQLWVNGILATRARTPDDALQPILSVEETSLDPAEKPLAAGERRMLKRAQQVIHMAAEASRCWRSLRPRSCSVCRWSSIISGTTPAVSSSLRICRRER